MPDRGRDDMGRFMRAIAALSAVPEDMPALGRRLVQVDGQDAAPLQALFAEVSETVLRRILTFKTELGEGLTLDVMERRVLRVLHAPDYLKDSFAGLFDHVLKDADTAKVFGMLSQFSADVREIYVVSALPEGSDLTTFGGVSAQDLNKLLEQTVRVPPQLHALQGALEDTKAHAVAMIGGTQGEVHLTWGNAGLCDILSQLSPVWCAGTHAQRGVFAWHGELRDDLTMLVAQTDAIQVLMLLPTAKLSHGFRIWHEVLWN